jgi:hypothetical protein
MMATKQNKVVTLDSDVSQKSLFPYRGVIKPAHVLSYGPTNSPMIMLLLVDSHMTNSYWPKYVRVGGLVYVRGALQPVPDHLTREVYMAREYQTLASHAAVIKDTFDLLEL